MTAPPRLRRIRVFLGLGLVAAVGLATLTAQQAPRRRGAASRTVAQTAASEGSLLDRLPRPTVADAPAAMQAARARGAAGAADLLWLQLFYGDPAAKQQAVARLRPATGSAALAAGATTPEMAFLQFVIAEDQGADRDMYQAALRLAELAPDDVATELAVRTLSGGLDNAGRTLLDAAPQLRQELDRPLADVTTAYMLGRPLLATVRSPGVSLTLDQALALSGRIRPWQLFGPFGDWLNLGFDKPFPIETEIHDSYSDGDATRRGQSFDNVDGDVHFPADWGDQGMVYAVTYLHADAAAPVAIRFYSEASARLWINGVAVLSDDRRSTYTPAVSTAAAELAPGWSRVVVKLAGVNSRDFDLVVRPQPGARLDAAATLPAGAELASAPRLLPDPLSLAGWARQRLADHPDDVVALWVDGVRRLQDSDPEHARVEMEQASKLAPAATPIWLSLADAYSVLPDASQSWAAAQVETASQQALKVDPAAMRAQDRLGHVYQSEGKMTDAAKAFAACADKGYADCDWSAFRLANTQHWTAEAAGYLTHALAESGSDWRSIGEALDFYSSIGDAADTTAYEHVLSGDPRADAELGRYYLRHGQAEKAVPALAAAAAFNDSSATIDRQYLEALNLADAPAAPAAAAAALRDFPGDWQVAAAADEIVLRRSAGTGVAQLRQTDFNRNVLRHEADFLDDDKFWAPWYHSAADVIRNAPSATDYPNASSILVLDQMVDRINPDSTRDSYIHEVYRVLNAAGIQLHGDVSIQAGSDLIRVRTIKADGTILLPEKFTNLSSISMPGLEPGDFIETEYVMHTASSELVPGQLDNSMFFVFGSSKEVYHYSDYVVLAPDKYPLKIDVERFPNQPTVKESNGWTSREWLLQKSRLLVTEPHMPEETSNLVPKVWISGDLTWDDISLSYADHLFPMREYTPEMREEALKLIAGKNTAVDRANAIFDWVVANIQPADDQLPVPARQYFTDRSGNRVTTFAGLLSAADVPYSLVMARPVEDNSPTTIPSLYQFQYPLIRVVDAGGEAAGAPDKDTAGWYDLNNGFAQNGYIAAAVRGGLALITGATGSAAFIHVPDGTSPLDGDVITITGAVDDSGAAKVHLELDFRGPNGDQIRDALSNQPASQLPQVYQQLALSCYPSATATGGKVDNMDDRQKSLIIEIDADVPDFIHQDAGGNWDIERLASPVGLLQRYAQLPFREHPLVINGDSFEQLHVKLTLPAKFVPGPLPQPENISNSFGRFTSTFGFSGGQLQLDRELDLNADTVAPEQYSDFRSFAESADNQDRLRITGTTK